MSEEIYTREEVDSIIDQIDLDYIDQLKNEDEDHHVWKAINLLYDLIGELETKLSNFEVGK